MLFGVCVCMHTYILNSVCIFIYIHIFVIWRCLYICEGDLVITSRMDPIKTKVIYLAIGYMGISNVNHEHIMVIYFLSLGEMRQCILCQKPCENNLSNILLSSCPWEVGEIAFGRVFATMSVLCGARFDHDQAIFQ